MSVHRVFAASGFRSPKRGLVCLSVAAAVLVVALGTDSITVAGWDNLPAEWSAYSGNPVITAGPPGAWDENVRERVAVVYDGGLFQAWYGGWKGVYDVEKPNVVHLGYATSSDGIHWTKNPTPVFSGHWTEDICVVKTGGTYYLYCEDEYYPSGGGPTTVTVMTSPDGVNWTDRGNQLATPNTYIGNPTVWKDTTKWYMLYEHEPMATPLVPCIKLATSDDGINWVKSSTDLVWSGPGDWENGLTAPSSLLKIGDVYYFTYTAGGWGVWRDGIAQSTDMIHWTRYEGNPISSQPGVNGDVVTSTSIVETSDQYLLYGWDKETYGGQYSVYFSPKAVPEPNTLALLAAGLIALLCCVRWRR